MNLRTGFVMMVLAATAAFAEPAATPAKKADSASPAKAVAAKATAPAKSAAAAPKAAPAAKSAPAAKAAPAPKSAQPAKTAPAAKSPAPSKGAPAAAKTSSPKKAPAAKAKSGEKKETAKPEAKAAAVNTAAAVDAPVAGAKRASAAKRDPFVSPVSDRNNEPVDCGSGKRCLVPDQTMLRGIVKAPTGMIAVVTNPQEKAYFLRENDPVYNGYVLRITPNSVVFRETVEDRLGRKSTREVVKKVNAPVV